MSFKGQGTIDSYSDCTEGLVWPRRQVAQRSYCQVPSKDNNQQSQWFWQSDHKNETKVNQLWFCLESLDLPFPHRIEFLQFLSMPYQVSVC
jgi:hypothetical protein